METLIATITTMAIVALAIPAMAAEKPYEPKTKEEWQAHEALQIAHAQLRMTDKWEPYVKALNRWNAVVKNGRAAEAKKVAEKKKAEAAKKKAVEAKAPNKNGKDFVKEAPKAKQRH